MCDGTSSSMLFIVEVKYRAEISLKTAKVCYTKLMFVRLGMECLKGSLNFCKICFKLVFCKNKGTFGLCLSASLLCEG